MGHHRPAAPAGPAALRGRAPLLLTGACPGPLVVVVYVRMGGRVSAHVCVNCAWSSNLVLAFVALKKSD